MDLVMSCDEAILYICRIIILGAKRKDSIARLLSKTCCAVGSSK